MTMNDLCERMKLAARDIAAQDPFGRFHIFVEDGNCEDHHLVFCRWNPARPPATEAEIAFYERMMALGEEERHGAYALSNCSDV